MAIRADTNVCAAGWERGRADENKASLSGLTRTRCEFYASKSCKSMMGVCDVSGLLWNQPLVSICEFGTGRGRRRHHERHWIKIMHISFDISYQSPLRSCARFSRLTSSGHQYPPRERCLDRRKDQGQQRERGKKIRLIRNHFYREQEIKIPKHLQCKQTKQSNANKSIFLIAS